MSDPTVPSSPSPEPAPGSATIPPIIPAPGEENPSTTAVGGLTPNIAAALAALFSLLGGILFLVIEKKNSFVRFYAMQSTILGIAWFVVAIAFTIILMIVGSIPLIGWLVVLLGKLVYLGFLVLTLYTAFKAFSDKEWEIPYIGKIARQQLAKAPTVS